MAVLGLSAIALDVPDVDAGIAFYRSAGLDAVRDGDDALLRCPGHAGPQIILRGGAPSKRLNHVRLRAEGLDDIAGLVRCYGGALVAPPPGEDRHGLWVRDPHGTLFHLRDDNPSSLMPDLPCPSHSPCGGGLAQEPRPPAMAGAAPGGAQPRRLGHVMLFSPDVLRSAAFLKAAFGMRLSDHAQDVAAFCCAQKDSDHHIVAFVKSSAIGFHHISFEVADLDQVGRAGQALAQAAGGDAWGLGRHGIGANFFHYIQDPWGSWFEYFSDVTHIDDFSQWTPANHAPETALAAWAPPVPASFSVNREA